jgi:hypothetical protein
MKFAEEYYVKKYIFFGKKILKSRHKEIFKFYFDIEINTLSKEELYKYIKIKLNDFDNLTKRTEEIKKGELI